MFEDRHRVLKNGVRWRDISHEKEHVDQVTLTAT